MRYMNRCGNCGCYLDPGEGHICEECLEKMEQRRKQLWIHRQNVAEQPDGQMRLAVLGGKS